MKNSVAKLSLVVAVSAVIAVACNKKELTAEKEIKSPRLPATGYDYTVNQPGTSINSEVATLGRVLFYDKFLSLNNNASCGGCHHQANAFSDDVAFSTGFAAGLTERNSPPIFNLDPTGGFFWDKRENDLSTMVLMPIKHNVEMGLDNMDKLPGKLAKLPYYPELFKKAFNSTEITADRISAALAQFLLSIRSENTRYDRYLASGNPGLLTAAEHRGADLFFTNLHCTNCHLDAKAPVFITDAWNTGLDPEYKDNGIGAFTGNGAENGVFKVPSIRNLALTAPYMHDGRFATLEEVVEHYNSNVAAHPNVSHHLGVVEPQSTGWGNNNTFSPNRNQFGMPKLLLKEEEKQDLVAFLKCMTDDQLTTDPKYADPFNY